MQTFEHEDKTYTEVFNADDHTDYHFLSDACQISRIGVMGGPSYPGVVVFFKDNIISPLCECIRTDYTDYPGLVKNLIYSFLPMHVQQRYLVADLTKKVKLFQIFRDSYFLYCKQRIENDTHVLARMSFFVNEYGYTVKNGDMEIFPHGYKYEFHFTCCELPKAVQNNLNLLKDLKDCRFTVEKKTTYHSNFVNEHLCAVKQTYGDCWIEADSADPVFTAIDMQAYKICSMHIDKPIGHIILDPTKKTKYEKILTLVAKNEKCALFRDDQYVLRRGLGHMYFALRSSRYKIHFTRGDGQMRSEFYGEKYYSLIQIPEGDEAPRLVHESEVTLELKDGEYITKQQQFEFRTESISYVDDIPVAEGYLYDKFTTDKTLTFYVACINDRVTYLSERDPLVQAHRAKQDLAEHLEGEGIIVQ